MPATTLPGILDAALADGPTGRLLVAFSGGPDSTALLHALAQLPAARARGLSAVHVDHGLHTDSNAWARHCQRFADHVQVPLRQLRVDVERHAGLGLEGAAREARYRALAPLLDQGMLLACAHHRDDQAETLLLRLMRGSGVDGLGAMRALRPLGAGRLWRPLLDTPRALLLAHLQANDLTPIEDPSNHDLRHDRAWLRHQLLPALRERWPAADVGLARSAALAAEAGELLDAGDQAWLDAHAGPTPDTLDVAAVAALASATQRRVLRAWVQRLGLPPLPGRAAQQAQQLLLGSTRDTQPEVRWGTARLLRWREQLHAGVDAPALPAGLRIDWDTRAPLLLPGGDRLALQPVPAAALDLVVRARSGGERIQLPGRRHRSALKQLLQAADMPPWQRLRLPLLHAGDGELLAAGDGIVSARLHDWLRHNRSTLRWTRTP